MIPLFKKKSKAKIHFLTLGLALLVILGFSSCLKDRYEGDQTPVSALTVIHGAPDAPAFDFVLNRRLVSPSNVPYAKRITYFILNPGTYAASFYKTGTVSDALYETNIVLKTGKYHSLFLAGSLKDSLSSLLLEDDLTMPQPNTVKVRFINLSPDVGKLDFYIDKESPFTTDKSFMEYTDFEEIPAGTYSAQFVSPSPNGLTFNFELKLTAGKIYTVWARGLKKGEEGKDAFENGLIVHDF